MKILFSPNIDKRGLGIPYPENNASGSNNIGYFDTKIFPEKIDIFPELVNWEELKNLIKSLSNTDNLFRSLRCGIAQSPDRKINYKVTSYITIAFEILEWNVKENFEALFNEFVLFTKNNQKSNLTIIEFELVPTSYNEHSFNAWSIDIWNHGFGLSTRIARNNWQKGINTLTAFFQYQNLKYGNELKKDRETIG